MWEEFHHAKQGKQGPNGQVKQKTQENYIQSTMAWIPKRAHTKKNWILLIFLPQINPSFLSCWSCSILDLQWWEMVDKDDDDDNDDYDEEKGRR